MEPLLLFLTISLGIIAMISLFFSGMHFAIGKDGGKFFALMTSVWGVLMLLMSFLFFGTGQVGFPSGDRGIKTGVVYSMPFYAEKLEKELTVPYYLFVLKEEDENDKYRFFKVFSGRFNMPIKEFPEKFIFFKNKGEVFDFDVVGVNVK